MQVIETKRLKIRPLVLGDLQAVHRILDLEQRATDFGTQGAMTFDLRERWLQWTILGYEQLARLNQPPFGERAVELKSSNKVIGLTGFVPCLDYFEQLVDSQQMTKQAHPNLASCLATTEFGLFYAIEKGSQRQGFATEAALAMAQHACTELHVKRVIATTTYDNRASIAVMQKLGMQLKVNGCAQPAWLQIVGFLENPIPLK